jgi:hypothetical protein
MFEDLHVRNHSFGRRRLGKQQPSVRYIVPSPRLGKRNGMRMKLGPCVNGLEIWVAWKESELPVNSNVPLEWQVWYEERKIEARGAWIEHRRQCVSCRNKIRGEYLTQGHILKSCREYCVRHSSVRNLGTRL